MSRKTLRLMALLDHQGHFRGRFDDEGERSTNEGKKAEKIVLQSKSDGRSGGTGRPEVGRQTQLPQDYVSERPLPPRPQRPQRGTRASIRGPGAHAVKQRRAQHSFEVKPEAVAPVPIR